MINAFSRLSRVVLPYLPERLSVSEEWKIWKPNGGKQTEWGHSK